MAEELTEKQKRDLILNQSVYQGMTLPDRLKLRQTFQDSLDARWFGPSDEDRLELQASIDDINRMNKYERVARSKGRKVPREFKRKKTTKKDVDMLKGRLAALKEGRDRLAVDMGARGMWRNPQGEMMGSALAHGEMINREIDRVKAEIKAAKKRK